MVGAAPARAFGLKPKAGDAADRGYAGTGATNALTRGLGESSSVTSRPRFDPEAGTGDGTAFSAMAPY